MKTMLFQYTYIILNTLVYTTLLPVQRNTLEAIVWEEFRLCRFSVQYKEKDWILRPNGEASCKEYDTLND